MPNTSGSGWRNVVWMGDHSCHEFVTSFRALVPLAEATFKSLYFEIPPMPSSCTKRVNLHVYP